MTRRGSSRLDRAAFAGFRFPGEVITVAVRWYLGTVALAAAGHGRLAP